MRQWRSKGVCRPGQISNLPPLPKNFYLLPPKVLMTFFLEKPLFPLNYGSFLTPLLKIFPQQNFPPPQNISPFPYFQVQTQFCRPPKSAARGGPLPSPPPLLRHGSALQAQSTDYMQWFLSAYAMFKIYIRNLYHDTICLKIC